MVDLGIFILLICISFCLVYFTLRFYKKDNSNSMLDKIDKDFHYDMKPSDLISDHKSSNSFFN